MIREPARAAAALLAVAIGLALPGSARAEEMLRPRWEAGVGVGAITMPAYRGSDQRQRYVFPVPYLVYRGEVLKVDREKVRGLLFKSERVTLDVSVNGSPPVDSDDSRAREGMPDLEATLEVGPQLDVVLVRHGNFRVALNLPLRRVLSVGRSGAHGAGWMANPTVNLELRDAGADRGWAAGIAAGPLWADARLHDYFYGVPPEDATADREAYRARGGYSGSQLTLWVTRRYRRLWAGAFFRANLLHGAAFEGSPLLGERAGYLAGLAVSCILAQSRDLVLSED